MPLKISAGLLMFRRRDAALEVLLAHPGGPYWRNKDAGAWTIPKGMLNEGEEALDAARREFFEETGVKPDGPFIELGRIRQRGGKIVEAWAFEGECDPTTITSNLISIEWPPRSGRRIEVPEIDRAAFFSMEEAKEKINPAQIPLLDELARRLALGTE